MGVSVDPKPVRFQSSGEMCRGDLYLPDEDTQPPIVVLPTGSAVRERGDCLRTHGGLPNRLAAFVFDYRTFGDSDGQPRNLVSPHRQLADWQAAVNHVRAREDVDGADSRSGDISQWRTRNYDRGTRQRRNSSRHTGTIQRWPRVCRSYALARVCRMPGPLPSARSGISASGGQANSPLRPNRQ